MCNLGVPHLNVRYDYYEDLAIPRYVAVQEPTTMVCTWAELLGESVIDNDDHYLDSGYAI
jgi:hypothetical protein